MAIGAVGDEMEWVSQSDGQVRSLACRSRRVRG